MDTFLTYLNSLTGVSKALIEAIADGYAVTNETDAFNDSVRKAVVAMKTLVPDEYHKTLINRCSNGVGSTTDYTSLNDLEKALMSAKWEPYYSENIPEDCWCARTSDISGHFGLVRLDSLNPRMPVAMERDGNGHLFPSVKVQQKNQVGYSVIVVGKYNGQDMMYTFHPGDPLEIMKFDEGTGDIKNGDIISAQEAIDLGFTYARAV